MKLHFAFRNIGPHVFLHMDFICVWVVQLAPTSCYCWLRCTCGSVDFKSSRHAGTDGGHVGQPRRSSTSSSRRCHLNPNWKDNTAQHNAFCKYSCLRAAVASGMEQRGKKQTKKKKPKNLHICTFVCGISFQFAIVMMFLTVIELKTNEWK